MEFKHETEVFKFHTNERAKLRNSLSDLRWYASRFCLIYGLRFDSEEKVLSYIEKVWESKNSLPDELNLILAWAKKISAAMPADADNLFYECWKFVHDFDKILKEHNDVSKNSARF